MTEKEAAAVAFIEEWGDIDGAHHKQWLLDQVLQALLGDEYLAWLAETNKDPSDFVWDEGIAP